MSYIRALTPEEQEALLEAAVEAKKGAYNPYSKLRVGAALLGVDGQIITGANIEDASWCGIICAERTAMVKAVSEGITRFLAIAVTSDILFPISPCGICRQFIREFCPLSTPILMASANYTLETATSTVKTVTLKDILPYSFGPEELDRPRNIE